MRTPFQHALPPANEPPTGRFRYAEVYGLALAMNNYLKILVGVETVLCIGLVVLNVKAQQGLKDSKPLVVRIDTVGRPETLTAESSYQPTEREIRYFLTAFVQNHYSRRRATLRESYEHSLYFLEGRLAEALMDANRKSKELELFLSGTGDEIDIKVMNVAIEDLRIAPYKASVDFEKIYLAADHKEAKRERYSAHFEFIVKDRVPNRLVPINPLGMIITYYRQDQAF